MDNQHKKIKGYRDLSQDEINIMNDIKAMGEQLGKLCGRIDNILLDDSDAQDADAIVVTEAMIWAEEGRKDLQVGIMKLVRSVARPTTF